MSEPELDPKAQLRGPWKIDYGNVIERQDGTCIDFSSAEDRDAFLRLVASRSPAQPEGVTDAWQRIDHPHRPREADYEVDRLKQRLEKFPGAVVETLTTWALMAPDQGSYAGALWALAEWAATRALRSKP